LSTYKQTVRVYQKLVAGLEWAAPVSLLLFRLWVALDFWRAGTVKFSDMDSTVSLFTYMYHVPFFPPVFAAYLATFVELVFPWFLGLGLMGRLTALILFVYNIVAVVSYPALWPNGLWKDFWGSGFTDHKVWGLMLFAIVLYGPGKISVDWLLQRRIARNFVNTR